MAKNNNGSGVGLFALVAGMAAGAAAMFFSKKENREKTGKVLKKAEKDLEEIGAEIKKNPKAFAKKVEKQGERLAKKVVKDVSKKAKSTVNKVRAEAKTAAATLTKKKAKKTAKRK